ncbi:MAG TPA: hypothetical protein V6D10_15990 [Trichocoleus sp.]
MANQNMLQTTKLDRKLEPGSLPTRQQLIALLQSKGLNPDQLKRMSVWEQIQLTKEYQQNSCSGATRRSKR